MKKISERDAEILRMRGHGLTLEEIGVQFELSRQRVQQIVSKYSRGTRRIKQNPLNRLGLDFVEMKRRKP